MSSDSDTGLTESQRDWLEAVRRCTSLEELRREVDVDTEDEAYFTAKEKWFRLRDDELPPAEEGGLPASKVLVRGTTYHVHGVTHSGRDEERRHVREHVDRYLAEDEEVYCEQGLWRLYFSDRSDVYEIDDYDWAVEHCRANEVCERIDGEHVGDVLTRGFDAVAEEAGDVLDSVRERLFSAVGAGKKLYGERAADVLGDSLSCLLSDPTALARGDDYRAYRFSRAAAEDPSKLGELQRYYHRRFLPQTLERHWLRLHAPEVELFTHARNERIADYIVYHSERPVVHVVVGAAHQPGVTEYLMAHASGERDVRGFEPVG